MVKYNYSLINPYPFRGDKKSRVSKKILRKMVWQRDKGRCKLCGIKIRSGEDWDLARNRAGQPYTFKNCFVAHHTCNISQGRKTLKQTIRGLGLHKKGTKKQIKKGVRKKPQFVNVFGIRMPKPKKNPYPF